MTTEVPWALGHPGPLAQIPDPQRWLGHADLGFPGWGRWRQPQWLSPNLCPLRPPTPSFSFCPSCLRVGACLVLCSVSSPTGETLLIPPSRPWLPLASVNSFLLDFPVFSTFACPKTASVPSTDPSITISSLLFLLLLHTLQLDLHSHLFLTASYRSPTVDTCLQFSLLARTSAEVTTHSLSRIHFSWFSCLSAPGFSISDSSSPLVLEIQVFFRPCFCSLSSPFPW